MDFGPAILEQLRQENAQLRQQNRKLTETVTRLTDQVERLTQELRQLREQLEQAQAANARQAAPFRRREPLKKSPEQYGKPGRRPEA